MVSNLTAQKVVMKDNLGDGGCVFVCDEDGPSDHMLIMDVGIWEEMGSPSLVTMTLEPGNMIGDRNG